MSKLASLTQAQIDLYRLANPALNKAAFDTLINSIVEQARGNFVRYDTLGAPVVADVDRIVTVVDMADGAQALAAQPDVPRNLTVALVDANASVTTGTLTIVGLDFEGNVITEVVDIPTSIGATVLTKIFVRVTSATISGLAGEAAGDTITIGVGNVIGLPNPIVATTAVKHVNLGGVPVTSPTIATGQSTSGVDASGATYNGSKVLTVVSFAGE